MCWKLSRRVLGDVSCALTHLSASPWLQAFTSPKKIKVQQAKGGIPSTNMFQNENLISTNKVKTAHLNKSLFKREHSSKMVLYPVRKVTILHLTAANEASGSTLRKEAASSVSDAMCISYATHMSTHIESTFPIRHQILLWKNTGCIPEETKLICCFSPQHFYTENQLRV